MRYIKASELRLDDVVRHHGTWFTIIAVAIGDTKVAVEAPLKYSDGTAMIELPIEVEILIKDRREPEPAPKPEPEKQWGIKYSWFNKMVTATLVHGDESEAYGPWCRTEFEARAGLLAIWGRQIKERPL